MAIAASKIKFDNDGLPIPKGYKAVSTSEFDDDGLPIPPKKKVGSDDGGNDLKNGTKNTSQSKSQSQLPLAGSDAAPYDFLNQKPTTLLPEAIHRASINYRDGTLTGDDVAVLGGTAFGKQTGLSNVNPKNNDALEQTAALYNTAKKNDIQPALDNIRKDYLSYAIKSVPNDKQVYLLNSFNNGNPDAIIKVRDNISALLNDKIKDIQHQAISSTIIGAAGSNNEGLPLTTDKSIVYDKTIYNLKKQNDYINSTLNEYGVRNLYNKYKKLANNNATGIDFEKLGDEATKYFGSTDEYKKSQQVNNSQIKNNYEVDVAKENIKYYNTQNGLQTALNNEHVATANNYYKGITTNNKGLIDDGDKSALDMNVLNKKLSDLPNQFPSVGLNLASRYVGDKVYENKSWYQPVTNSDVKNEVAKVKSETPELYQKFKSYFDELDAFNLPSRGFGGGLSSGFDKLGFDMTKFFKSDEDIAAEEINRQQQTNIQGTKYTSPQKIIYDKDNNAFREIDSEEYGKYWWNGTIRNIGQGIPTLAAWAGTTYLTGGLIDAVGGVGIEGIEGAGVLKPTSTLTGRFVSNIPASYLYTYNENRSIADGLIDEKGTSGEVKKGIVANAMTLATPLAFEAMGFSPNEAALKSFQTSSAKDLINIIKDKGIEAISKDDMATWFNISVRPKLGAILKSSVEGGSAQVLNQKIDDLISIIANPKAKTSSINDNVNAFIQNGLMVMSMGLPGLAKEGFSPTHKDILYRAGQFRDENIQQTNEMLKDGKINQQQADQAISVLNTLSEEVNKVSDLKNKNGLSTNYPQKRDVAINNFRKRAAEMLKDKGHDINAEKVGNEADKNTDESLSQNHFTPIEETETFKQFKSLNEGIEKVADIDPAAKYQMFNAKGESKEQSGADILNELSTKKDLNDISSQLKTQSDEKERQEAEAEKGQKNDVINNKEGAGGMPIANETAPSFTGLSHPQSAAKLLDLGIIDEAKHSELVKALNSDNEVEKDAAIKFIQDEKTKAENEEYAKSIPLTINENKDWNSLSMQERLNAAKENLPEITDGKTDKEIVDLADTNAKFLLAKMHGEEISKPVELKIENEKETTKIVDEKGNAASNKSDELITAKTEKSATAKVDKVVEPTEKKEQPLNADQKKHAISKLTPEQRKEYLKAKLEGKGNEYLQGKSKLSSADVSNGVLKDDKNVGDYVSKAQSVLKSLYPKATLEIYDNTSDYTKAGGDTDTRGIALSRKDGNHRILLNLEQIKKDNSGKTAFHEVLHPIVFDAFGVSKDELIPIWNRIATDMKGVEGMDKVFEHASAYSKDEIAPEGITELLTQIAAGNIKLDNVPKSTASKIIDLLNSLFEKLGIGLKLNSIQDFHAIAERIKNAFDTGNAEDLRDVIKSNKIDKYIDNINDEFEKIAKKNKVISAKDLSPEKLKDSISELKDEGFSDDEIREALKEKNLSDEQINKILPQKKIENNDAKAFKESAARLKEQGDEEGAAALEKRANELEQNKTENNATTNREVKEGNLKQHQEGDKSGETAEASSSNSAQQSREEEKLVGVSNAAVNEDRLERGLKPIVKEAKRKFGTVWNEAKNAVISGKTDPRLFVSHLSELEDNSPNSISKMAFADIDNAIVLMDRVDLTNQRIDALNRLEQAKGSSNDNIEALAWQQLSDIESKLKQNDLVADKIGAAQGRALSSRNMLSRLDYTLASMKREIAKYYKGKEVPPEVEQRLKDIEKQYNDAQKKLADYEEKFKQQKANEQFNKNKPKQSGKSNNEKLSTKLTDIASRIRTSNEFDNFLKSAQGGIQKAGIDLPTLKEISANILDAAAKAAKAGEDAIEFIKDAVNKLTEDIDKEKLIEGLNTIAKNEGLIKASASEKQLAKIKELAVNNNAESITKEMITPLRRIINDYAKNGSEDLNKVINEVHNNLKDSFQNLTKEDIRDAYSGYGDVRLESKNVLQKKVSIWKQQAVKLAQLDDVAKGLSPSKLNRLKNGEKDPKVEQLAKQLGDNMKAAGITWNNPPKTVEEKNQRALQSLKTRLQNQIDQLTNAIESKTPIDETKSKTVLDDEAKSLVAQRDVLKEALDKIVAKEDTKLTSDELIDRAGKILDKQISDLQKDIENLKNKTYSEKEKQQAPFISTLELKRAQRDGLKELKNKLNIDSDNNSTEKQIALEKYKDSIRNKLMDYNRRLEDGDFEEKEKEPVEKDAEAFKLDKELRRAQTDFTNEKRKAEQANKTRLQKIYDNINKWKRFSVLTGIPTIGKLATAVIYRNISTPIEEIVGSVLHFVPLVRTVSKLAPREGGGFSSRAEGDALSQWAKSNTYQEAKDILKNGQSELDREFGKYVTMPPEALEVMGRLHGAMKNFAKRNEFARSYRKRMDYAIKQGADPSDDLTQLTAMSNAYIDANRSIFMQDNFLTDLYNKHILKPLEADNSIGIAKFSAAVLRFFLPIIKVPTNFVFESANYAYGSVRYLEVLGRGGVDLINKTFETNMSNGLKDLTPKQADNLMRSLKKGSIGLGAGIALGFFIPSIAGGYYLQNYRKKDDTIDYDQIRIAGVNIPTWATHFPLFMCMQLGSTMRRVFDSNVSKGDTNAEALTSALFQSSKGLMGEVPFFNTYDELREGELSNVAAYQLTSLIPLGLQEGASYFDTKDGETFNPADVRKTSPQNFKQSIENDIPGFRGNVPSKLSTKNYKHEISIKSNYTKAIKEVENSKDLSSDQKRAKRNELIKKRDEAIQELYTENQAVQ